MCYKVNYDSWNRGASACPKGLEAAHLCMEILLNLIENVPPFSHSLPAKDVNLNSGRKFYPLS